VQLTDRRRDGCWPHEVPAAASAVQTASFPPSAGFFLRVYSTRRNRRLLFLSVFIAYRVDCYAAAPNGACSFVLPSLHYADLSASAFRRWSVGWRYHPIRWAPRSTPFWRPGPYVTVKSRFGDWCRPLVRRVAGRTRRGEMAAASTELIIRHC
jgi:hypothetical protein